MAFPGVELCPAVPELPEGAALPSDDGELCATTQSVQHKITDSNVSFFMDLICTSYACRVSEFCPRACCLCLESRFKYFRLGCGGEYPADSVIWRGTSSLGCVLVKRSLALASGCDGSYLYGVSAKITNNTCALSCHELQRLRVTIQNVVGISAHQCEFSSAVHADSHADGRWAL